MAESTYTDTNNAPVGPATVIVEIPQGSGPAQIPLDVYDPDGDRLWYQMEPRPWPLFGGLEWDPDAGALCYEPFPDFIGVESFTLIVSDGRGGSIEQRVTVAVGQPAPTGENHVPVAPAAIVIVDGRGDIVRQLVTVNVAPVNDTPVPGVAELNTIETAPGSSLSVTLPAGLFTDAEGDAITLSLARGAPSWLSFDPIAGTLSGTVPGGVSGDFAYEIVATDPAGAVGSAPGTVWVAPADTGPAYTVGGELIVNTHREGWQTYPAVTALEGGNYVVVWETPFNDLDEVFGRIYAADGTRIGAEFRFNSYTAGSQESPSLLALPGGGFVVSWTSVGQDGSGGGVYGQLYGADGARAGAEFRINATTAGYQQLSSMAATGEDSFVVTWLSRPGSRDIAVARRFSAVDGTPLGGEIVLDPATTGSVGQPDIAARADGSWLAVWTRSDGAYQETSHVYAQRFYANGTRAGTIFQVDRAAADGVFSPSVTALAGGGYVVAWTVRGAADDPSETGIHARLFSAGGAALGPEFRVNAAVADYQIHPDVTALAHGGFAIGWTSRGQDGSGDGVYTRLYSAAGVALTPERLVNATVAGDQGYLALAGHENGGYGAAWMTPGQYGSGYEIAARFFAPADIRRAGTAGSDYYDGAGGRDTLLGYRGDDRLRGLYGDDWLAGHDGNDRAEGGRGADRLNGGAGDDTLLGDAGVDRLWGHSGHDVLAGGLGADTLFGGAGADTFLFASALDSGNLPGSYDTIRDFDALDVIDLAAIDADGDAANGDTAFSSVARFTGAGAELRIFRFNGGDLYKVTGDLDGDRAADFTLYVRTDGTILTAADFTG
ncbi:MAG TPA: putative Ig domain-containing protein [Allosphingosinicella sp.]|jgi:Ca2+-binding RTX toxin-like protein